MATKESWEDVITKCREKLSLDPNDIGSLFQLGYALRSTGKLEEAASKYETLLKVIPEDVETMHAYGRTLLEMHKLEEAVVWLKKAAELGDTEPLYFADLGDALRSIGLTEEARLAYETGLSKTLPGEETVDRLISGLDLLRLSGARAKNSEAGR